MQVRDPYPLRKPSTANEPRPPRQPARTHPCRAAGDVVERRTLAVQPPGLGRGSVRDCRLGEGSAEPGFRKAKSSVNRVHRPEPFKTSVRCPSPHAAASSATRRPNAQSHPRPSLRSAPRRSPGRNRRHSEPAWPQPPRDAHEHLHTGQPVTGNRVDQVVQGMTGGETFGERDELAEFGEVLKLDESRRRSRAVQRRGFAVTTAAKTQSRSQGAAEPRPAVAHSRA